MMTPMRTGLRIRGHRGHPAVRGALIRFARWLRHEFDFPIRVPVYLNMHHQYVTVDGETVVASFFYPDDPDCEPYIRIATGDFDELLEELGRNDALASYIYSLAHEVVHYQQWIRGDAVTEEGVEEMAEEILRRYADVVAEP